MTISWSDVEELAPELVGLVPAGMQTRFLAKVDREVGDSWEEAGEGAADDGRLYLAAHLATKYASGLGGGAGGGGVGPVTSESLGPMSVSYGSLTSSSGGVYDGDYSTTKYGIEYLRMVNNLPSSLGFVP